MLYYCTCVQQQSVILQADIDNPCYVRRSIIVIVFGHTHLITNIQLMIDIEHTQLQCNLKNFLEESEQTILINNQYIPKCI